MLAEALGHVQGRDLGLVGGCVGGVRCVRVGAIIVSSLVVSFRLINPPHDNVDCDV